MEYTNCPEKETEPISNECEKCNEKKTLYGKHDFIPLWKSSLRKCSSVKPCLTYVCFGFVVCACLFLLQKNKKLESKIEVEQQEQHKSSSDFHTSEALKSPLKDIYLLTNGTLVGEKVIEHIQNHALGLPNVTNANTDNARPIGNSDASKANEMPEGNHLLTRRHFFNIGMREDTKMQDCFNSQMKHSFPDIDYAFLGYDVVHGYPLAHGHDPGFTFPIFHADYINGKQTADCRYSVPKGLLVVPDVSCVTSFTSDTIRTSKQLKRELSLSANFFGSGFGVAFSASAGFKQASSELSANDSVYIISSASCNYYFSKFQKENPPPFTEIFVYWITKLNSSTSDSAYLEFLRTFGTHFPTEVLFGARFIYEHKMKSSVYEKKLESKVNVEAQASLNGLYRVGGGFSLSIEEQKAVSSFSEKVETKTITVGSAPPSNGDAMTWAASVRSNPVPSKYKLEPIEKLFQEEFMGELNVDYEKISIKLKTFKELYYLKIENLSNERFTKMLTVENGGQNGHWFDPQFCPAETFAIGFNMKYEADKATVVDSTGLNGINLLCAYKQGTRVKTQKPVRSVLGHRGDWTGDVSCPKGNGAPHFLQSFALMVQQPGSGDDTMANAVRFTCRDLQKAQKLQTIEKHIADMKGQFGKWSEECPKGSAICGLQTRVEPHIPEGDNTALNDIRFFCCTLK